MIVIGLENVLVVTKSVVSTPVHLDVKLRVAQGQPLTVCLSVRLSVCLSVCLSVFIAGDSVAIFHTVVVVCHFCCL